jgi:excisionase family DNA binding protein
MHRRLQFDMRKNPASERRHGSRLAVGSTANKSHRGAESLTSLAGGPCQNLTAAPIGGSSQGASPHAATGEGRSNDTCLLTVHEVAELLHVPVSWVYGRTRTRCTARLPGIRLGKYWRFREQEIHKWIETQRGASHGA